MPNQVNNPHDAFMKSLLADVQLARDFLASFLPEALLQHTDLDTLRSEKTSFVSEELQEVLADAVFSVQLKTRGASREYLISILLEHKSYADEHVAFQLLTYLANGYREQLKNEETLRPIVPFLFYHGKSQWTLKPLAGCFDQTYEAVLPYVPRFDTIFTDLTRMPEEAIMNMANAWLRAALLAQKYSHRPKDLAKQITRIFQTLNEAVEGNF